MPPVHCCCVGILLAVLSSLPQSAIQSFKKTSSNDDRLYSRKRFSGESSASKRPDRIIPIWKIGSIITKRELLHQRLKMNSIKFYRVGLSSFFDVVSGDYHCSSMVDTLADKMIPDAAIIN
jgi:hypothetical protein